MIFLLYSTLIIIKTVAAYLSGSFSVISSVVDSACDIFTSLTIWVTNRKMRKPDPYQYPRGRSRLEPIALIIISIVMAVASVQMIMQSAQAIISGKVEPDAGWATIGIMILVVITKLILVLLCLKFASPSTKVLAQDHRNDCISNTGAIVFALIGTHFWVYVDPIGAILISIYCQNSKIPKFA